MRRELTLTTEPIDEPALIAARTLSSQAGAVVQFVGVVRGSELGTSISGLDYESFEAMARHQFNLIFNQLEKRWPLESVRLVHRLGPVRTNEPSLWVEVVAGHRGEAFAACQWLIDEMKRIVPIWKRSMPPKEDGGR